MKKERKSEKFISLIENYNRVIHKRNDYTGLVIYTDIMHSDYSTFNTILVQNGFPKLDPLSVRVGLGVSHKRGNTMLDMYFGTAGFGNGSSKNNEKIRTSLSNILQIDLGFDLLHAEQLSLYPFGGLSARFSELKYRRSGSANPNYTSLANMRTDQNASDLESFRLGYQYGAGIDYAFHYNRNKTFKTIVFIKAGVNKPFSIDTYKSKGIPDYKPGIKQGDWLVSVGFKFGNKR